MNHATVQDILAIKGTQVRWVAKAAKVIDAVWEMNTFRVGSVMVMDAGRPVGIFTERDVLVRVIAEGRSPETTEVGSVMTRQLVSVTLNTSIVDAMRLVTNRRCRHLPVVEGGVLLGLISSGDLTKWLTDLLSREVDDLSHYIHGPSVLPVENSL